MALLTPTHAAELYSCIDRDGSRIVKDNPQDGLQDRVLKEVYGDLTAEHRESKLRMLFRSGQRTENQVPLIHSWTYLAASLGSYDNTAK